MDARRRIIKNDAKKSLQITFSSEIYEIEVYTPTYPTNYELFNYFSKSVII